jgi:quercetin dioxygenase-like cupin family protein
VKRTKHFIFGVLLAAASSACFAQTSGVDRTEVTRSDVSVPGREAIVSHVEIAPGGKLDWHTHFGDEISYVESGTVTLLVAGKKEQNIVAGGGFVVQAGLAHSARNNGSVPVELVVVHVVEKNKALATPVAPPAE